MENASKALIMAGSILLSVLVIALLVYGYTNLSALEQTKQDTQDNIELSEYMARFEQFNRTLYGSELLSLGNLQEDYNTAIRRYGGENQDGYQSVSITVIIKKEISNSPYFTPGTYQIEQLASQQETIENQLSNYEKNRKEYNNRSVKYYSQKTYREIAIDFDMAPPTNMTDYDIRVQYLEGGYGNVDTKNLIREIDEYTRLNNSIYNTFRTGKRFKCTDIKYDDYNGRIVSMTYEEI